MPKQFMRARLVILLLRYAQVTLPMFKQPVTLSIKPQSAVSNHSSAYNTFKQTLSSMNQSLYTCLDKNSHESDLLQACVNNHTQTVHAL